ncbi:hypothetical protein ONZ45_g12266 [Pleurotus djamor]|nr:hypothetical protein ONZ45_g12266 [Pleurotus djamor]
MSAGSTSGVHRGRKLSIYTTAQPPVNVYSDSRTHGYQGPIRTVRLPRVTASGGGAIAKNSDGTRCAVAGIESLRVLTLSHPSSAPIPEHKSAAGRGGHRIDASRNFWEGSGLTSASTDVSWGSSGFEHKIFTSARNGEFIMWDANWSGSGKYSIERKTKDHTRSIHRLSISQFTSYCITGSADGDVRLWDIRDLSKSVMRIRHPTSVRTVAFSPFASHTYQAFTGLDNGNIYRWDLKMGQRGQLDRLPVAHSGPVTSLDWCNPGGSSTLTSDSTEGGLGWVASGGLDHCVKVWNLSSSPHLRHKPTYTLHPSFPVRHVLWRPSYPLEVAIVSNAEFGTGSNPDIASPDSNGNTPLDGRDRSAVRKQLAGDPIEIWDVRRGWIAKWSVNGSASEGGVTDIEFGDSHAIWVQHTSGTFAQLDLRNCTKPIDAIPRAAATWQASGALALVTDAKGQPELPYDDMSPDRQAFAEERKHKMKALGDPSYNPASQTLGVYLDPAIVNDVAAFTTLAHQYIFEGHERRILCEINANLAFQAGQHTSAQVWMLLGLTLVDLVPTLEDEAPPPNRPTALLHQSNSAPPALTLRSTSSRRQPDANTGGSLRTKCFNLKFTECHPDILQRIIPTSITCRPPSNDSKTFVLLLQAKFYGAKSHETKLPTQTPVRFDT